MDKIEFLHRLDDEIKVARQKIIWYLDKVDKVYYYVHVMFSKYDSIPDGNEIKEKIKILDGRCKDIIVNTILIQNLTLNSVGNKERSVRSLKEKLKKFVDEIIQSSSAMRDKLVFNYLLTRKIRNFVNSLETFQLRIKTLVDAA